MFCFKTLPTQNKNNCMIYMGLMPTVNPFALFSSDIINKLMCTIIEKETKQQARKTNDFSKSYSSQPKRHQKLWIFMGLTPTVNPFALFPGKIINNLMCPIIEKITKQEARKTN